MNTAMQRAINASRRTPVLPAAQRIGKWKVLRGDDVVVVAGKDRGRTGTVVKVDRRHNTVLVRGLNLVRKHIKGTEEQAGTIVQKEAPLHVSNVALRDPRSGAATRVAWRYLEDGSKVRIATVSGMVIPKPLALTERRQGFAVNAESNTAPLVVAARTYDPVHDGKAAKALRAASEDAQHEELQRRRRARAAARQGGSGVSSDGDLA